MVPTLSVKDIVGVGLPMLNSFCGWGPTWVGVEGLSTLWSMVCELEPCEMLSSYNERVPPPSNSPLTRCSVCFNMCSGHFRSE